MRLCIRPVMNDWGKVLTLWLVFCVINWPLVTKSLLSLSCWSTRLDSSSQEVDKRRSRMTEKKIVTNNIWEWTRHNWVLWRVTFSFSFARVTSFMLNYVFNVFSIVYRSSVFVSCLSLTHHLQRDKRCSKVSAKSTSLRKHFANCHQIQNRCITKYKQLNPMWSWGNCFFFLVCQECFLYFVSDCFTGKFDMLPAISKCIYELTNCGCILYDIQLFKYLTFYPCDMPEEVKFSGDSSVKNLVLTDKFNGRNRPTLATQYLEPA